jgi:hypothetical protein
VDVANQAAIEGIVAQGHNLAPPPERGVHARSRRFTIGIRRGFEKPCTNGLVGHEAASLPSICLTAGSHYLSTSIALCEKIP